MTLNYFPVQDLPMIKNKIFSILSFGILALLPGCWGKKQLEQNYTVPKNAIKDCNYKEALSAIKYYESTDRADLVCKAYERAISTCSSNNKDQAHAEIKALRLAYADYCYQQKQHKKAQELYKQYAQLYPGCPMLNKAVYREIKSAYNTTLDSSHDQTKTYEVLELSDAFLEKAPASKYREKVQKIAQDSNKKLCKTDLGVCETYLKQYKYTQNPGSLKAAENRLAHLKQEYLAYAEEELPKVLALEMELALAQNKTDVYNQKKRELQDMLASSGKQPTPKSYAHRF